MKHKTGFYVWIHGDRHWHRTIDGAVRQKIEAQNYCSNVQIIDVETGKLIRGNPE